MIKLKGSSAILAALVVANVAIAAEPPAPRQPIGPNPRVQEMLPPLARPPNLQPLSPLAEDRIRIVNNGDQQLFISYWDGESAWRHISIESGRSTDVVCPKCTGAITVAYHNGREDKRVAAKGGSTYVLGWSAQGGVWVFTTSPNR
jgi:hypothetical protein